MQYFYETKIKYYDEEKEKPVTKLYLVSSLSFTEAEANITQYLTDLDINDFEVLAISKNKYEDLVYNLYDTEYNFYEAKVSIIYDLEVGSKHKFLIASLSIEEATEQVIKFVEDSDGKPRVTQVKHREIEDLVLTKDCKENGTIIIGFQGQKEIEQKIEIGLDKRNLEILIELKKV